MYFDVVDIKHGSALVTLKQAVSLSGEMVLNEPTPIGDQMNQVGVETITAPSSRQAAPGMTLTVWTLTWVSARNMTKVRYLA